MIGPVLGLELLLGERRGRNAVFQALLTGWLVLLFLFFYAIYLIESRAASQFLFPGTPIDRQAAGKFATNLIDWLVIQQLFVVLIATPALTAGSLTDEKATGTLQYLLTADLTMGEIIVGKVVGRVAQVAKLALCGLPMLCFVGVFGGLDPLLLLVIAIVTFLPALALGPMSLLAAVWSRQTRDAVILVYAVLVAGYLVLRYVGGLHLFNPMYAIEPLWNDGGAGDVLRRVPGLLLAWSLLGLLSLGLATWRLRPAYVKQLQGEGRSRRHHWWLARRAAVSDEPIRWKERHVEGIAPLAFLRRIPRWLGVVLIFSTTTVSSVLMLATHLATKVTVEQLVTWFRDLNMPEIWSAFGDATGSFILQANVALLLATLIIGIRCSGAITGERERQTWEPLLLSPLPVRHMIRGKLWGIIGASYPYLLAYFIPAALLSILAGPGVVIAIGFMLFATWLAMAFVGASGLYCSVRSKSSWRSLLGTLGISYVGGFILFVMALPLIGIVYLLLILAVALFDQVTGTSFVRGFAGGFGIFLIGSYVVLLAIFAFLTWWFVNDSEKYVADRERVRHWRDEPLRPMRRGKAAKVAAVVQPAPSSVQD